MPGTILTDARVKALRPRGTAYDIRDANLKGFGVRVLSSGRKRYFVHCQHRGERFWKIVGDADAMGVDEARSRAARTLTAIRRGEGPPPDQAETCFETVAETVFERHRRLWKPGTLTVNRSYLKNQILPHFQGRHVADIDRQSVRNWYASLRATPVAADRSMPVLSVILRQAELMGLRPEGSNPCLGIRRYRRKGRTRFLSDAEIRHLAAGLSAHEQTAALQVAVVRLLLLTGCRKSEILTLRWSDYREGNLFLPDTKTGPRTVWLSRPAREVLGGLERTGHWVFPAPRGNGPANARWLDSFWHTVRTECGLHGVRLHDLRHTYASIALRQGETILTIARLLGHRNPKTTLRYTHSADQTVMDAAETVGAVLGGLPHG
ncbi:MAG: tyrosine-type recombinase/integrase [Alphaproteobacteria bacterium]|nr:tyrosine-type recombinase/integrase [Alphaproteobacteria bacterium]